MKDHARAELRHRLDPTKKIGNPNGTAPSICENHRRMWRTVDKQVAPIDPKLAAELKTMIEVGYDMAKRMDKRLRAYKTGKVPKE